LSYYLLILDGHSSRFTDDFFDFCSQQQDLYYDLFPPFNSHITVMFALLSRHYSTQLSTYLHGSQDLLHVKKRDFILLFWPSYKALFMHKNILKAFKAAGVEPACKRLDLYSPQWIHLGSLEHHGMFCIFLLLTNDYKS
jgi:hypothetical protein